MHHYNINWLWHYALTFKSIKYLPHLLPKYFKIMDLLFVMEP